MIARAVAYAIDAVRSAGKSTVGSMIAVGILLAALGASAGVALRSLAGPAQSPPSASPDPAATFALSATALQPGGLEKGANDKADPVDPSARQEAPVEEPPLATEPVARVAMTARATLPMSRGPRAHGVQRSDHRPTRGRIHPTSARPLARRTTTSKAKVP
jgi:hypothetical protein